MLSFSSTSLNDTLVPTPSSAEETSATVITLPKQGWYYFLVLPTIGLLILVGWLISAILYQFTGWQKFEEHRSLFSKGLLIGAGLVILGLGPALIRRLPYGRSRMQQYRIRSYRKRLSGIYQLTGQFLPPKYRLNHDQVFANVTPTWGLTLIIYSLNDFHNLIWLEEARRKAEASGLEVEVSNAAAPTEISLEQEATLWAQCLRQSPSTEWVSKLSEYRLPVAAVPRLEVTNLEITAQYYLKLARLIRKELAQAGVSIPRSFTEVQSTSSPEFPKSASGTQVTELPKSFTDIQPAELSKSFNEVEASDFLESFSDEIQLSNPLDSFDQMQPNKLTNFAENSNGIQAVDPFDFLRNFDDIQLGSPPDPAAFVIEEIRLVEDEEVKLV